MSYYYTYYSYEEWGRGYIGSRGCKCLPEEDIKYFGSYKDKTFKPTHKIILRSDYATRSEAYADEVTLHEYYKVVENTHFANKAYQTTINRLELSSKGGLTCRKNNSGIFSLTKEERTKNAKNAGKRSHELGVGIHGLTAEQRTKNAKKGAEKARELGVGIFDQTKEEKSLAGKIGGKKGGKKSKELGRGIFALTKEQRSENSKKSVQKTNSQKWMCLETGFITNAGSLTRYQKKRGIDTTNRIRIE